mgnify:CR=1 FL=1
MPTNIHTYLHTHLHAYIYRHTDIQTYRHTPIHTYMHTYIHKYTHTYTHRCMHTCMHKYIIAIQCTPILSIQYIFNIQSIQKHGPLLGFLSGIHHVGRGPWAEMDAEPSCKEAHPGVPMEHSCHLNRVAVEVELEWDDAPTSGCFCLTANWPWAWQGFCTQECCLVIWLPTCQFWFWLRFPRWN